MIVAGAVIVREVLGRYDLDEWRRASATSSTARRLRPPSCPSRMSPLPRPAPTRAADEIRVLSQHRVVLRPGNGCAARRSRQRRRAGGAVPVGSPGVGLATGRRVDPCRTCSVAVAAGTSAVAGNRSDPRATPPAPGASPPGGDARRHVGRSAVLGAGLGGNRASSRSSARASTGSAAGSCWKKASKSSASSGPARSARDSIPIWIGGNSPRARRLAARGYDGWLPDSTSLDEMTMSPEDVLTRRSGRSG